MNDCPSEKIYNPKTKRCVDRKGKVGKMIIAELGKNDVKGNACKKDCKVVEVHKEEITQNEHMMHLYELFDEIQHYVSKNVEYSVQVSFQTSLYTVIINVSVSNVIVKVYYNSSVRHYFENDGKTEMTVIPKAEDLKKRYFIGHLLSSAISQNMRVTEKTYRWIDSMNIVCLRKRKEVVFDYSVNQTGDQLRVRNKVKKIMLADLELRRLEKYIKLLASSKELKVT